MVLINQFAKGYLYYVSLKGVTGANMLDTTSLKKEYQQRKAQSKLPLMVGFGIKTPEMAAEIADFADGVIVGAALITQIMDAYDKNKNAVQEGVNLINSMRRELDKLKLNRT